MQNKVIQLRCDFNDVFIVVECQAHGQSYDAGFNTHLSQLVNFTKQNNCFCTSLIFFCWCWSFRRGIKILIRYLQQNMVTGPLFAPFEIHVYNLLYMPLDILNIYMGFAYLYF